MRDALGTAVWITCGRRDRSLCHMAFDLNGILCMFEAIIFCLVPRLLTVMEVREDPFSRSDLDRL